MELIHVVVSCGEVEDRLPVIPNATLPLLLFYGIQTVCKTCVVGLSSLTFADAKLLFLFFERIICSFVYFLEEVQSEVLIEIVVR